MSTPKPLPPHSRALRRHRFQANVLGPKNERGGRVAYAEGRFVSFDAAQEWADLEHPEAEVVRITLYAASRGWQPQAAGRRVGGRWTA